MAGDTQITDARKAIRGTILAYHRAAQSRDIGLYQRGYVRGLETTERLLTNLIEGTWEPHDDSWLEQSVDSRWAEFIGTGQFAEFEAMLRDYGGEG